MGRLSVTPRGRQQEPAETLSNPLASTRGTAYELAPWLADNPAYNTYGSGVNLQVPQATQDQQPGLGGYMPEPLLPAGNVQPHIPFSPLGWQGTEVGVQGITGAPYNNHLDEDVPEGLANAPWHYHMGYHAAPNGVSVNGASAGNNDHALVSPLGYTNPAVAPNVLVQTNIASLSGTGFGLGVPVVLGGNSIG